VSATPKRHLPERPALRLLSPDDLRSMKPPSYLLNDLIPAGGTAMLFGPSGCGKSFVALDWALCVATGAPWGRRVPITGPVVYIVGEGLSGMLPRLEAWEGEHDVVARNIYFASGAVNFLTGVDVQRTADEIDQLHEQPVLIVIDTLARCMVGGDENSAKDTGMFVAGVDRLRTRYGAAVLIVHHTGKTGELEVAPAPCEARSTSCTC
jgi:RecA-family ATPase